MKRSATYTIFRLAIVGATGIFALTITAANASDRIFVYPNGNQSESVMAEDRYQCHRWAVSETGFDPMREQPGLPRQPVRVPVADNPSEGAAGKGALAGAAIGAVVGAIDDHHVGRNAAIGAVVGTIAGGIAEQRGQQKVRAEAEREAHQQAEARAADRQRVDDGRANYRRAITACLEGKNYTVK